MKIKPDNRTFVIIDGSALICSSYFGSLPEELKYSASKNLTEEELVPLYEKYLPKCGDKYVNGVDIYMSILYDIVCKLKPDKLAVCFDEGRANTFRRAIYPAYKAQRGTTAKPLVQQIQMVHELTKQMGFQCFSSREYEADDYAGSIAKIAEEYGYDTRLLTKDRDYFQLATDKTKIWWMVSGAQLDRLSLVCNTLNMPNSCVEFGVDEIKSEIGLMPNQITDWKGISGDPSDNIPGIKGVSDKTAVPLINHYGSLEKLVEDLYKPEDVLKEEWKALGVSRPPVKLMKENYKDAEFYKDIATIKCDLPVPTIDDYYSYDIGIKDFEALANKYNLTCLQSNINGLENLEMEQDEYYK